MRRFEYKTMEHEYYVCWYRLDRSDAYLIWYSTESHDNIDRDGVFVDSTSHIPVFASTGSLRSYAKSVGVQLEEGKGVLRDDELLLIDLDPLQFWLQKPRKYTIDPEIFLSAWNLFADVARSVDDPKFDNNHQRTHKIYSKLFWGNNLPALTPAGKLYTPIWTKSEVGIISHVLSYGLQMFRSHTKDYSEHV